MRLLLIVAAIVSLATPATALNSVYEVRRGDSLWEIALRFKTTVGAIKKLNDLRSSRIYPGQTLRLGAKISPMLVANGPYYWRQPKSDHQKTGRYTESAQRRPSEDYADAVRLISAYRSDLAAKLRGGGRQKPLGGWKIVLDPGHGGRDPGAIVSNKDGRNRSVHVVEDEYVFDVAMRIYERLTMYGADVELTVISPNHLKRNNTPAKATFVHEQNEIYNDAGLNRTHDQSVRPGLHNIGQRVRIANRFFEGAKRSRTLFVSLHADNSPKRPRGPLVIHQKDGRKVDKRSNRFAKVMQRALDDPNVPSQMGTRNLAVLRGNRAQAEVLIEIRNVHFKSDAWALRFHGKRQEDAERIVKGILDYAENR